MRRMLFFLTLFLGVSAAHADVQFLTLSDIHYGTTNDSKDGHDTGTQLLAISINKLKMLAKQADFIITLGDFPTHQLGASRLKEQYIRTIFHELYLADQDAKKPFFYVTGNNDSLGGNYHPFTWQGRSVLSLANDWNKSCLYCKNLIIDDTHMIEQGYYSTYVVPGNNDIILIALNSIQFTKLPFFIRYPNQENDAVEQLKWLKTQLATHRAKQLLIAMHIPPGTDYKGNRFWENKFLTQFVGLLNEYGAQYDQISILTAHTHMADFRKMTLANGASIYAYATPSISRIHHNHPGMILFDLNSKLALQNYTVYYTTVNHTWENLSYKAIDDPNSIFPQCKNLTIARCLDSMTNDQLCHRMEEGAFYGAKNNQVNASVCEITYPVNK